MRSISVVLLASYAALASAVDKESLPLVYESDFETGIAGLIMTDPDAWKQEKDGANGVLALVAPSKYEPKLRSPLNMALVDGLSLTDFIFEADVKQTGREYGHRDLCFFYGYQGPEYFYYTHLATTADENANSIFLVNNAARVSIAKERTDGTKWTSGYHKIRIVRDSESGLIEIFFDDMEKPVMRTIDRTFTYGGIGVGSFDDTGYFDNIRIWGKKSSEGSDTKNHALAPKKTE